MVIDPAYHKLLQHLASRVKWAYGAELVYLVTSFFAQFNYGYDLWLLPHLWENPFLETAIVNHR